MDIHINPNIKNTRDTQDTEEIKPKKHNIFGTMGTIFTKEYYPSEEEVSKIIPYQLNQWLSSTPNAIKTAHFLNSANKLPKDIQFKFAYFTVPKSYRPKFPKKSELNNQDEIDYNILMYKYKCNIDTARQYKKLLPETELSKLRNQYKNFDFKNI